MTSSDEAERAEELFAHCLREQFEEFRIVPVESARVRGCIVGLVAMRDGSNHGSVGVAADRATLEQVRPAIPGDFPVDHHDWVGELANLVQGRFKLALRGRASMVRSSTPVVLDRAEIRLSSGGPMHVFTITAKEFEITAWFDLGDIERTESESYSTLEIMLPGDVVFFD